ncbi:unnamed protein product, partial [Ascophyllum nodosum]
RAAKEESDSIAKANDDDIGEALNTLADLDLSGLTLSDFCTNAVDVVLGVVQDDEWVEQYAEPGVIGGVLANSGLDDLIKEHRTGTVEEQDLVDLMTLESNPILYKAKFFELHAKMVSNLEQLRIDFADPAKIKAMLRDLLKIGGFEGEQIDQVMEVIDNPEILAAQIKALLNDPFVNHELTRAAESLSNAASVLEDADLDEDE